MPYAIVISETGEVFSPSTWTNYNPEDLSVTKPPLYRYKIPKKVYDKLSHAKVGFSHIPETIKPYLSIAAFTVSTFLIDGAALMVEQKDRKEELCR